MKGTKKKTGKCIGFMCPNGPVLCHPMADLLLAHAESGNTVDFELYCTNENMSEAIKQGPRASAKDFDVEKYSRLEARKKETQGYCTIHYWNVLKTNHPLQLKLSPIAAIPHKYRVCRLILDLLFGIRVGEKNQK